MIEADLRGFIEQNGSAELTSLRIYWYYLLTNTMTLIENFQISVKRGKLKTTEINPSEIGGYQSNCVE